MLKKFQLLVIAGLLSILLVVPLAEAASSQEQEKACAAYLEYLTNIVNDPYNNILMDDSNFWMSSFRREELLLEQSGSLEQMLAANEFSLVDIDGDGIQELFLDLGQYFSTPNIQGFRISLYVFKYNASTDTVEEIDWFQGQYNHQDPEPGDNYFWSIVPLEYEDGTKGLFGTKFFNNGYVFRCEPFQGSYGKSIWPFWIDKFDGSEYVSVYHAHCFDSINSFYSDEFPYTEDYDGDGVIYYLDSANLAVDPWDDDNYWNPSPPLTLAEYKKAINDMIGDAQEVIPVWHNITLSNIQQVKNELEQARNKVNVYVNGQKLTFDQPPVYSNDRLLVPVRAISEALGAKLLWDEKTGTVTVFKDSQIIIMTVGDQQVSVNGKPKTLEIAPMNSGGRIMVPLRFLSENLDCQVTWEGNTKTVRITQ